jgi:AcrR family transcriptional regulator
VNDTRRRTRLDPDLRRGQILEAAASAFREDEYSNVSLDALAERAGVTRGLLHHYFGTKRDLYLAVVERAVRIPANVPIVPPGVTGDLAEVVHQSVGTWMKMVRSAGGLWPASASHLLAENDVDLILTRARDELVERMIVEVPFPEDLDRSLLRSALRSYSAMAGTAIQEWLITKELTTAQTAALLETSLLALAEAVVPAMAARNARA